MSRHRYKDVVLGKLLNNSVWAGCRNLLRNEAKDRLEPRSWALSWRRTSLSVYIYIYFFLFLFGCSGSSLWHKGFLYLWVLQTSFVMAHRLLLWLAGSLVVAHGVSCAIGVWDRSSLSRDLTHIPCLRRQILFCWTTREVSIEVDKGHGIWWVTCVL